MENIKWFLFILTVIGPVHNLELDPVQDQLVSYKLAMKGKRENMTTNNGAPIEKRDTTSLNKNLILNRYFMETTTHVVRERIPERIVHAKGGGGFGYFEVTHDVTQYIKSDFLSEIGKRTPVAMRFSPIFVERGASDSTREPRGFAVRFYTKEGNFDIPGLSTSVFAFKDPILFPSFTHAFRRNPANHLQDSNMVWDFMTTYPESTNLFIRIWGEYGIPQGYRHMDGYGIHTYQIHNNKGEVFFAKFNFMSDSGTLNLTSEEGMKLDASDPDSFNRDLYEAIGCGRNVSWTFGMQLITLEQAKNASIDVFDVTVDLPYEDYPFIPIGKVFLNENPKNYHAQMEQIAFCPGNTVPGVDSGYDTMYQARVLSYRDSQLYRLNVNYHKIKVNCPFSTKSHLYYRDGLPPVGDNEGGAPNYFENSFGGPTYYIDKIKPDVLKIRQGKSDNLHQVSDYYEKLSEDLKKQVVSNIVASVGPATQFIKDRAVKMFQRINSDLGNRVAEALKDVEPNQVCETMFP